MTFTVAWLLSIVAAVVIAERKKQSVIIYFILALVVGPLAVLIAALVSPGRDLSRKGPALDPASQLADIKNSMFILQQKINRLEDLLSRQPQQANVAAAPQNARSQDSEPSIHGDARIAASVPQKIAMAQTLNDQQEQENRNVELALGRDWLSRIGIGVFTLGIGFLISYTFKYFGPYLKIAFGFLLGGAVYAVGMRLEQQDKFRDFSRALLAGGWAIIYFTAYAAHHFPASRIIQSPLLASVLLGLVTTAMILRVLRHKSQGMMAVALLMAYVTTTLGAINSFTLFSTLLLGVVILFFVYRFQWVNTLVLGIVLSYGVHWVWIMPGIGRSAPGNLILGMTASQYATWINFLFLSANWLVFLVGSRLVREIRDPKISELLAGASFGNIAFYGLLSYPLVLQLFPAQKFAFVFGLGIVYLVLAFAARARGQREMYYSDLVAGILCVTLAVPLHFSSVASVVIWFLQVPLLLFLSTKLKDKIYRYLSYSLAVWAVFCSFFGQKYCAVAFLGITWKNHEFIFLVAAISMAVCFFLTRRLKKSPDFDEVDTAFDQVFSTAAFVYLTCLIFQKVPRGWLSLALTIEGVVLLLGGLFADLRRARVYAYLAMLCAIGVFLSRDIFYGSVLGRTALVAVHVILLFSGYYMLRNFKRGMNLKTLSQGEDAFTFSLGVFLLMAAVFRYVHQEWVSLALGAAGAVLITAGLLARDRIERIGGFALLAVTLGRVIFVDIAEMAVIYKIITFISLGLLLLAASYFYNRVGIDNHKK